MASEMSGDSAVPRFVNAATRRRVAAVPANGLATLRIPAAAPTTVRDGGTPLAQAPGVTFLGYRDGVATYHLESGSYDITSVLR